MTARSEFYPSELIHHGPGSFSLVFSKFDKHGEYLKTQGGMGGGYSWEALVIAVAELYPVDLTLVEFDPESDMFAVACSETLQLRFIASIIQELMTNDDLMLRAISKAKAGGYFA